MPWFFGKRGKTAAPSHLPAAPSRVAQTLSPQEYAVFQRAVWALVQATTWREKRQVLESEHGFF